MKRNTKILSVLLSLLMTLNAFSVVPFSALALSSGDTMSGATVDEASPDEASPDEIPASKRGDVDGDGEITLMDATLVQFVLAGYDDRIEFDALLYADIDRNGRIDIIDVTLIERWIAQIEIPYVIGGFCYYDQNDYDEPYGDDTIAGCGDAPTAIAMVASNIKGKRITPIDAVSNGLDQYYLNGVGTLWSYFGIAANRLGITLEKELGSTETASIMSALKKGKIIISAQRPGRFTKGGHFIVLAGLDEEEKIIVYDPDGANQYVGTAFTMSEIAESGTHYWVFGK